MVEIWKVRKLLEAINTMAVHLNEDEISDIGEVLLKATERLIKEQESHE